LEQQDAKKDEQSPSKKQGGPTAVIHFPKSTKKKMYKGVHSFKKWIGPMKPILLAAMVSTIFATLAFSVIDPEVASEPTLIEKTEPPTEETTATPAAVTASINDQSMWVVQAGVFKEVASAELTLSSISTSMPAIQTQHEDLIALWVGAASDQAAAKEIATNYQTEQVPLYVKEVSRSGGELEISDKDQIWIQQADELFRALLGSSEATAANELVTTKPESKALHPLFEAINEWNGASAEEKEKSALQIIKLMWELPLKN